MTTITLDPSSYSTDAGARLGAPVRGLGANADPAARMAFLRAAAERVGLDLPETILPEGTALLPVGQQKLEAEADAHVDAAWHHCGWCGDVTPVWRLPCTKPRCVEWRQRQAERQAENATPGLVNAVD